MTLMLSTAKAHVEVFCQNLFITVCPKGVFFATMHCNGQRTWLFGGYSLICTFHIVFYIICICILILIRRLLCALYSGRVVEQGSSAPPSIYNHSTWQLYIFNDISDIFIYIITAVPAILETILKQA